MNKDRQELAWVFDLAKKAADDIEQDEVERIRKRTLRRHDAYVRIRNVIKRALKLEKSG